MATSESPAPLPIRLRDALKEEGISQRAFAKLISDETGANPEHERRQLLRHLAGENTPDDERARLYARLLDKPGDFFVDERSPRAQLLEQLVGLGSVVEDLRALVEERLSASDGDAAAAELLGLDRRLAALEAAVEEQGKEMTKALRGVARRLGAIQAALEHPAPARARRVPRATGEAAR